MSAVGPKPTWNGNFGVSTAPAATRGAWPPRLEQPPAQPPAATRPTVVASGARAAEREPDGDLASSGRGPRQLQHREIRADDQQDGQRSDNAERGREHQNARLDDCGISKPTFAGSRLTPTFRRGYAASSCLAKSAATACVRSRSKPGRSRPTTSRTAAASVQQPWRTWLHDRLHTDRNPDLGPESQPPHALESTRRHAGHDELAAVDADDAPGDIGSP